MPARPLDRQTYEQLWCGLWWDCQQCGSSSGYASRELAAYHGEPYTVRKGSYEVWNGAAWLPLPSAHYKVYWLRRTAGAEQRRRAMARAARRGRRKGMAR
jgi:hypothetical protein